MKIQTATAIGVGVLTIAGTVWVAADEAATVRQKAELGAEAHERVEEQARKLDEMELRQKRVEWGQYQILEKIAPEAAEHLPEPERPR